MTHTTFQLCHATLNFNRRRHRKNDFIVGKDLIFPKRNQSKKSEKCTYRRKVGSRSVKWKYQRLSVLLLRNFGNNLPQPSPSPPLVGHTRALGHSFVLRERGIFERVALRCAEFQPANSQKFKYLGDDIEVSN